MPPSEGPAPRIIISNVVALNGGDAAILQGLVQGLRLRLGADTHIVALSAQPDVAARHHSALGVLFREPLTSLVTTHGRSRRDRRGRGLGELIARSASKARFAAAFALLRRGGRAAAMRMLTSAERELVELYSRADFVVATGGTYLVENYPILPRVREFRLAMKLGLPLALFTQSMGPFRRRSAARLRPVFEYSELVLLRDEPSLSHLRATGAGSANAVVAGDVAFTLGDPAVVAAAGHRALPTERPLRIGMSVRDWPFFKTRTSEDGMRAVVDSFALLSRHLAARGAHVEFVSTCQGIPEYWKDDSRVAGRVAEAASAGARAGTITVDRRFRPPDVLVEHLRTFDLFVSMRMHGAILALAAGVPVLPVAYEPKTKDLFDRLGFGEWVLEVETLTPEALVSMAERVLAELPGRRAELFAAVQRETRSAERGLDLLAEAILASGRDRSRARG